MTSTLTRSYIVKLPELSPRLKEMQLAVEWWQKSYAEAGCLADDAWRIYDEAIEANQPREFINEVFITTQILDDICRDAWGQWQNAKRNLLAIQN